MQVARRGVYNASLLSDLGSEVVQRYFRPVADRYEISKTIREMVIFARGLGARSAIPSSRPHQLPQCPDLSSAPIASAHPVAVSLRPSAGGATFLGKSESVAQQDLPLRSGSQGSPPIPPPPEGVRSLPATSGAAVSIAQLTDPIAPPAAGRPGASREQSIVKAAAQIYVPPSVVVNADMQIQQHVLGDASTYLQFPPVVSP